MTLPPFSSIIRARLDELRMPIGEVADRLGVTSTRVRQLLKQPNMTEETFRRLCDAAYLTLVVTPVPIAERAATWPALPTAPWRDTAQEPPAVAPPAILPE